MRHLGTRLALTVSLCFLSACSERVVFLAPKFQMGPNDAQSLVVTPDGEVVESGRLTVNIRGFLDTLPKKRRLLATIADVERVVVEVSASGLSFSQTLDKAAITNGQTTATFTGIPEGTATVTMKAYNLNNQLIGQASQSATVTAGATTTVDIQLQLDPTYTQPASGGTTSTGSITANGTIIDGPVIQGTPPPPSGTILNIIHPDPDFEPPVHFDLDSLGNAWHIGRDAISQQYQTQNYMVQQSPTGTELKRFPVSHTTSAHVYVDSADAIWCAEEGKGLTKFAPDGTPLVQIGGLTFPAEYGTPIQEDGQGSFWINAQEGLFKYTADGTLLAQATFQPTAGTFDWVRPGSIAVDGGGQLWVLYHGIAQHADGYFYIKEAWITRHDADGTELERFSVPVPPATGNGDFSPEISESHLVIGGDGTLWYGSVYSDQLHKVKADGTFLGTVALGAGLRVMEVDASGSLWVATVNDLHKLSSTGDILTSLPLYKDGVYWADIPSDIAIGASGVWVVGVVGYDRIVVAP